MTDEQFKEVHELLICTQATNMAGFATLAALLAKQQNPEMKIEDALEKGKELVSEMTASYLEAVDDFLTSRKPPKQH